MARATIDILQLRGIRKQFGQTKALDGIDLSVKPGEVHALLGENGAGKSTLMNIAFGLVQRDSGSIVVGGEDQPSMTPRRAMSLGIGMVHQHFRLVDEFTVAENVALGSPDWREARARGGGSKLTNLMSMIGLQVPAAARVADLSLGLRQRVEILKALFRGARLLILDEPTALLTPQETDDLFSVLRTLAAQGAGIVVITHKLREALAISTRVTVLRSGRVVMTAASRDTDESRLSAAMVGAAGGAVGQRVDGSPKGDVLLGVESVSYAPHPGAGVRDISMDLVQGEILGIAGVEGNGQDALASVLAGTERPDHGRLWLGGEDITQMGVSERLALGLAHIPGDRQGQALVLDFSLRENTLLGMWPLEDLRNGCLLDVRELDRTTRGIISDYEIRGATVHTKAAALSGGNQQRLVIGRQLVPGLRALIAVNPTRGLDVGATRYVHSRILDHCARNAAGVLISSDLDEVLALSDRIGVLYRGELAQVFPAGTSREEIGQAMMGGKAEP